MQKIWLHSKVSIKRNSISVDFIWSSTPVISLISLFCHAIPFHNVHSVHTLFHDLTSDLPPLCTFGQTQPSYVSMNIFYPKMNDSSYKKLKVLMVLLFEKTIQKPGENVLRLKNGPLTFPFEIIRNWKLKVFHNLNHYQLTYAMAFYCI